MKPQIPWLRVFVEGVVIVGSILLAFGIDAAWQERQEREEEQKALASLFEEFAQNRQLMLDFRDQQADLRNGAVRLLAVISDQGDPPGSYAVPDSLLDMIMRTRSFRPVRGALTSLLSSGRLTLIRDDSLRVALSAWPDGLLSLTDHEENDRQVNLDRVTPFLMEFVPWTTIDHRAGVDGFNRPSRFEGDYVGLLESLVFENWVDLRVFRLGRLLGEYDQQVSRIDSIRSRISDSLR